MFSTARPSKIYPNWDFWFENKPSGNPAHECGTVWTLHKRPFVTRGPFLGLFKLVCISKDLLNSTKGKPFKVNLLQLTFSYCPSLLLSKATKMA
jgi:hypothetical protein